MRSYKHQLNNRHKLTYRSAIAVVFCAWLTLIAGCSTIKSPDRSVVELETLISSSCLSGISIGKSTKMDVERQLGACSTFDQAQRNNFPSNDNKGFTFLWRLPNGATGIADVNNLNQQVVHMIFAVTNGIRLESMLLKYGEPQFYRMSQSFNPDKCVDLLDIIYADQGLGFQVRNERSCDQKMNITAATNVTGYSLFEPGSLEQILQRAYFLDETTAASMAPSYLRWTGLKSLTNH